MSQNRVRLVDAAGFKALAKKVGAANKHKIKDVAVVKAIANLVDEKAIDREQRIIPFTISTPSVDREGDTIAVEGWDLANYAKNPVVLFGHDHYQPPIAKSLTTFVEGAALKSRAQFVSREISEFAYMVFQLYAEGYMRATSVGFIPHEWTYADGERKGGMDFSAQEMLEYSCVPVPANPEALIEARTMKGINVRPLREWAERTLDTYKAIEQGSRENIERMYAFTDERGRKIFDILADAVDKNEIPDTPDPNEEIVIDDDPSNDDPAHEQSPHTPQTPSDPANIPLHDPDSAEATGVQDGGANPSDPAIGEDAGKTDENGIKPGEGSKTVVQFYGDEPDQIRWNKSLSSRFDVDRAQFQPASAEYALASSFIGCEVKRLTERSFSVPSARMGSFLTALNDMLAEADIADIRNLDKDGKEYPPYHEMIQLNSRLRSEFLVDGIRFMVLAGHKMTLRVTPSWWGLSVSTFAERGDAADAALKLVDDTFSKAAEYKFLKGEAFSLSGEFLTRGTDSFENCFLADGNRKAVQRVIDLVNSKGSTMEPRGMMFVGPPGTGKTLSCRVMMNAIKGTYIWVSSRDLARSGAFSGIQYAIDLARENAPATVLLEDVDNWLGPYTIDMLKAEMDGLQQHRGVVTVLTTNFPELMPKALIDRPGRFHDVLRFDLPDDATRRKMVKFWIPDLAVAADIELAVRETAGYSGAHIRDLARWSDLIREQDGLDISASLVSAIAKMKEQRDIINGAQTAGSRYRAPSFVLQRDFASGGNRRAADGVPGYFQKAIEDLSRAVIDNGGTVEHVMVGDVSKTIIKAGRVLSTKNEGQLKECLGLLQEVLSQLGEQTEDGKDGKAAKAGRVLSQANESRIRKATTILGAVLEQVAKPAEDDDDEEDEESEADKSNKLVVVSEEERSATEHIIVFDDDVELGDIDLRGIEEAVSRVAEEAVMRLTGRVDLH
jgi:hypothetical protein